MPEKTKNPIIGAAKVVKDSFKTVLKEPAIVAYPAAAIAFTSVTLPIVGASIFSRWYGTIFHAADEVVPHSIAARLGLVGFSVFYSAFVGAFFTVATSAMVLAKLDKRSVSPFYGMIEVFKHFWRVCWFALLSVFLIPVGFYAQRRKLPKGIVGVTGSSVTLHMANLAPAILTTQKSYGSTVRNAINTLGQAWREGLVLKIAMFVGIFIFLAAPKLVQHHFFSGLHASNVGWLVSLELAASSFVGFKVINTIFMTVLYHGAENQIASYEIE